ncbi:PREDICTED: uncharacterized protein LOC107168417 [Diuraphis noxia]|uniref:uncharacterized protein LOC107168417 n=1 Tax=Diuraphis noxia TaxID=143948 RepID=UPI0007639EF4|nr:PREDICTED: uncharacterized protein LOC107168417 [Diuraphis noxia]
MNDNLESEESTILKFVQDFFANYDKNRHILHTLFPEDGTFIVLGNRMTGHSAIQQAMLTMATTTHQLFSIDIIALDMQLPDKVQMFQVLCAGDVVFGNDAQTHGFTATLLVYFLRPNILNVVSFNERCQWPKLS